jgi:hypothetical protein
MSFSLKTEARYENKIGTSVKEKAMDFGHLLTDETHLEWKKVLDEEFPFQVDLPFEVTQDALARIVKFCEPHDIWSASVHRPDGIECMRVGFKDARAARNFRRKFNGEMVVRHVVH